MRFPAFGSTERKFVATYGYGFLPTYPKSRQMTLATRNDFAAFMEPTGLHRHVLLPLLQVTSRIKELGWNKTLPREL
jgi:hypothetical protein